MSNKVAIVGMSCRFPNGSTPQDFWNSLLGRTDSIGMMNEDRWKVCDFFDPDPKAAEKSYQNKGAFLNDINDFDAGLFNISPAEAKEMNPSQKLMLELVWEAIANSNSTFNNWLGTKTGVYVGNIWSDYEHHRKHINAITTSHSAVGQASNIIANRISYTFGFSGASLIVDTGCSSSIVALHQAVQSILDNSIDQAVVGGVNHILDPDQYVILSKFGGLSKKGRCSTFSDDADGFVRGEGAGIVLVKPLDKAIEDGDEILAVIEGTSVNNNGFNASLPATSTEGQISMLHDAYRNTDVKPPEVHYIEAHGTGTRLGDPTETRALGRFFGENRTTPLSVGSVKTNIGHLEGAAGIAGLIKVLLAFKYDQIPPSLHSDNPNPEIDFEGLKVKVQSETTPWPVSKEEKYLAGVNSFGWGGTNAHVALSSFISEKSEFKHNYPGVMLRIHGHTKTAIKENASMYLKEIEASSEEKIQMICAASLLKNYPVEFSKNIAANNKSELIDKLTSIIENEIKPIPANKNLKGKVCFIFPGQGSQWVGMGKDLMKSSDVFRNALEEISESLSEYVDWNLLEVLNATDNSYLERIDIIQPALFAIEIALAKLWESWGIKPDAIIGHSMGECAAAYIAGALDLTDAAKIITKRSKLMASVAGQGYGMAVTELNSVDINKYISGFDSLSVAVYNSNSSTVIAGKTEELSVVLEKLDAEGIFCKEVKVDVASHSLQMEPLVAPLFESLQSITPKKPELPFYSTVIPEQDQFSLLTPNYWTRNLRDAVQFNIAVEKALNDDIDVFIEMSPHPVLTQAINSIAKDSRKDVTQTYSLLREKNENTSILASLGNINSSGLKVDFTKMIFSGSPDLTCLPQYQMQRTTLVPDTREKTTITTTGNRFSGSKIELCDDQFKIWTKQYSIDQFPFLRGHKVSGEIVLPGTTYASIITEIIDELGHDKFVINELKFTSPVTLNNGSVTIQSKVSQEGNNVSIGFYMKDESGWVKTAIATVTLNQTARLPLLDRPEDFDIEISGKDFYSRTENLGISYSGSFNGISNIHGSNGYYFGLISPQEGSPEFNDTMINPAILDCCMQMIFASTDKPENFSSGYLESIKGIKIYDSLNKNIPYLVEASFLSHSTEINPQARIYVYNMDGDPVLKIEQVKAQLIPSISTNTSLPKPYQLVWEEINVDNNNEESTTLSIVGFKNSITDEIKSNLENISSEIINIDGTTDLTKLEHKDVLYIPVSAEGTHANLAEISAENVFNLGKIIQSKPSSITILTNRASGINSEEVNLSHAGIWQATRTAFNENPEIKIRVIDLDSEGFESIDNHIAAELPVQSVVRENSYYQGKPADRQGKQVLPDYFSADDVMVITGFKGAAFEFIGHLVRSGVQKIALISRNPHLNEEKEKQFKEWQENNNVEFVRYACDVSDSEDFKNCLTNIENCLGKITGFIHAAGIIEPERIDSLDLETIKKIIAVKLNGAITMDQFDVNNNLKHFILFSSASVYMGLNGQGAYITANSMLDAIAKNRVSKGKAAVSVNWGVIKDAGMVADNEHLAKYAELEGFIPMMMKNALNSFVQNYNRHYGNIGIIDIDWSKAKEYFRSLNDQEYFSLLADDSESSDSGSKISELIEECKDDNSKLSVIEDYLKRGIANITQISFDDISSSKGFKAMGLDSLMAVQFRNYIESGLNFKLPISQIWKSETIEGLTNFAFSEYNKLAKEAEVEAVADTEINWQGDKNAEVLIFAFHDAGGSSALYSEWQNNLPENCTIASVDLPGRGMADQYSQFDSIEAIVENVANKIKTNSDSKIILLGHSMGGAIATEVCLKLEEEGITPYKLIVSSTPALNSYNPERYNAELKEEDLLKSFPHINAISDSEETTKYLLSLLKSDLKLVNKYRYNRDRVLNTETEVWYALNDDQVSTEQALGWIKLTTKEAVIRKFEGDHGYLYGSEAKDKAIAFIKEMVKTNSKKQKLEWK
ncbi:type I polyketide synthase [Marinigracilibium pacificum]|uniref:SDR family NAD(P)-dependent oxidoreductase n=1 Tax=Marinigracilibium pacificum TaxID=2729599 RepID=A0A848IZE7_9BACT|nr:type I polyketide synthase [Marinigracilibium pacificum]NMM48996.1 SDR family NAD(P)-dependent oxidoreductase [Marinigracilibium pacificum]